MDIDELELTPKMIKEYKNKIMFKKFDYYDYIVPIYNDKNLDDVLSKLGYKIDPKDKTASYKKIFPGKTGNYESFINLKEQFRCCKNSNLIELLDYLDECVEK